MIRKAAVVLFLFVSSICGAQNIFSSISVTEVWEGFWVEWELSVPVRNGVFEVQISKDKKEWKVWKRVNAERGRTRYKHVHGNEDMKVGKRIVGAIHYRVKFNQYYSDVATFLGKPVAELQIRPNFGPNAKIDTCEKWLVLTVEDQRGNVVKRFNFSGEEVMKMNKLSLIDLPKGVYITTFEMKEMTQKSRLTIK